MNWKMDGGEMYVCECVCELSYTRNQSQLKKILEKNFKMSVLCY